jgi:hypothetical protein
MPVLTSANAVSLNNEIDIKLISALELFSEKLKEFGLEVPAFSSKALFKLSEISDEKKHQIMNYYFNWLSWLNLGADQENEVINDSVTTEINFAKNSLKHYKLTVDDNFWKTIENDHVIEIYGTEMVQLYRSFNFFKYSGYSLLDIAVFEWFNLWERPKKIVEMLFEEVGIVFSKEINFKKCNIPSHILREVLNTGDTLDFTPRACIIEFKNIAVLKNSIGECAGFICTAVGTVIARGNDVSKIGMV